jgi:hypothetical protein
MWPSNQTALVTPNLVFKPTIIKLYEWDEKKVIEELKAKAANGEKVNMLQLIYYPLCGRSARYYEKALEAFEIVGAVYMDRGERTRIASMIALGVLKFLSAEERKSLRNELEVMDIILDESILDLADEALQSKYETMLKDVKEEKEVFKLYVIHNDPKTVADKLGIALEKVLSILSAVL